MRQERDEPVAPRPQVRMGEGIRGAGLAGGGKGGAELWGGSENGSGCNFSHAKLMFSERHRLGACWQVHQVALTSYVVK